MNIVSQICNDRHREIFDLTQNYKLISSASKSRKLFLIKKFIFLSLLNSFIVDLNLIKLEIDKLKQELEVKDYPIFLSELFFLF